MMENNPFAALVFIILVTVNVGLVQCEDPYVFLVWNVTYGNLSPLGVQQKVILINGQFPGPTINCTSNNNIIINLFNNLDEPFLLHWNGIQQRKNSWEEGLPGTNCPIKPGTNHTLRFQVKDQIGTYFYFPSVGLQKAAGGFGAIRINSRPLIPVPFPPPEAEYHVFAGDWYSSNHSDLRKLLDSGRPLGRPDGILINGRSSPPPEPNTHHPEFTMKSGKTYRYRLCNVGIKTSLNFRIQGHKLKLVEMEGSHTVQNVYESIDLHVGQCASVLVVADQRPGDYFMVASTRFTKEDRIVTAVIRYEDAKKGKGASPELPPAPEGWAWSLNQFRSFRWNLSSSAARPNPQGSFHYGAINITRTVKLVNSASSVDGLLRYAINGVSHTNPDTPLKLAEYYGIADKVFEYNLIGDNPPEEGVGKITVAPNVLNFTFRGFVEIILENREKSMQSWHMDGYSFFPVAIETGRWKPSSRDNYNLLDAVSRHTIQVYPKSWAAIMVTLDNAGMWNLRSAIWERNYLGQQLYISVLSPARSLRDEYNLPDEVLLCGQVEGLPKPRPYSV